MDAHEALVATTGEMYRTLPPMPATWNTAEYSLPLTGRMGLLMVL
jgi:hypothetical protein